MRIITNQSEAAFALVMKFVTYTSTPGLERFPESECFLVYRSTYDQLMQHDTEFRRRVNRFRLSIVIVTVLLLIILTPSLGMFIMPDPLTGQGIWQAVLEWAVIIVSSVAYFIYVLRVSFAAQEFQNEQIGRVLQDQAA